MNRPATCELCGYPARLTIAMLRVAWDDRTILVKTCLPCGAVAWRTVEALAAEKPKPAKVRYYGASATSERSTPPRHLASKGGAN